jgi:integrase
MKSKTDQEGVSKLIPISTSLHSLITEWKSKYQLEEVILRPVERYRKVGDKLNSGSIRVILNRLKINLGEDVNRCHFSGHSFRFGAAIDLLEAGASLEMIMLRGGWRSEDNAMNYLRSWS